MGAERSVAVLFFLKRRAPVVFEHGDCAVSMELERRLRLVGGRDEWMDGLMMDGRWING